MLGADDGIGRTLDELDVFYLISPLFIWPNSFNSWLMRAARGFTTQGSTRETAAAR